MTAQIQRSNVAMGSNALYTCTVIMAHPNFSEFSVNKPSYTRIHQYNNVNSYSAHHIPNIPTSQYRRRVYGTLLFGRFSYNGEQ